MNAAQILRYLARLGGPEGVAAIARGTGISPSSVFSILRTLNNERLVVFKDDTKTYQLGIGLSELALGAAGCNYVDLIQSELERLSIQHQIQTSLWRVAEDAYLHSIACVEPSASPLSVSINLYQDELAGAAGFCIAALRQLPDAELYNRSAHLHWASPPSFEQYKAGVATAHQVGWVIDQGGLYHGVSMVASAITDRNRQPRFILSAIGITAQYQREQLESIGAHLYESATHIGDVLFR
ncbi:IclR family transcriptional regulator [Pseudomonas citronellolis]|uniref:IclR family transcriptional regulator n=1 Tax=Pseudomonas citronellolis TaxID=53408 RepID=UPI0021BE8C75|nr:helix-turn-helix domain-containing protein [Pseudomonas citronellolis]UXJ50159.1 helix-turn-helix domain-containing protein [Pseudomonas citronellolis]